ncbi:MAG: fimbrial protein [Providencia sp.]|jgi:hypothetical protein|nr:fimbrial protein [Providencia sp.]
MYKQRFFFIKNTKIVISILIFSLFFSQIVTAQSFVANIPVNQSDYESIHHGKILISAMLFNSPCNLHFNKLPILTECGAGNNYRILKLSDSTVRIPVSIRFYEAKSGIVFKTKSLTLQNGNNFMALPSTMKEGKFVCLEVSYE